MSSEKKKNKEAITSKRVKERQKEKEEEERRKRKIDTDSSDEDEKKDNRRRKKPERTKTISKKRDSSDESDDRRGKRNEDSTDTSEDERREKLRRKKTVKRRKESDDSDTSSEEDRRENRKIKSQKINKKEMEEDYSSDEDGSKRRDKRGGNSNKIRRKHSESSSEPERERKQERKPVKKRRSSSDDEYNQASSSEEERREEIRKKKKEEEEYKRRKEEEEYKRRKEEEEYKRRKEEEEYKRRKEEEDDERREERRKKKDEEDGNKKRKDDDDGKKKRKDEEDKVSEKEKQKDKDKDKKQKDNKNQKTKSTYPLTEEEDRNKRRAEAKAINESLKKKTLSDFEKIRILGRGSVGKVYLVRLKGTNQLYAMKVLEKQDMIQKNKVKRVLTEREVLATAEHPFIVTLYYSFQSQNNLVFIMQYCAGGEFYLFIKRQPFKCLTEDETRFYAAEVLLALEYLHMMGFIYRDLKPENIIMHASGHIKLTDFDLSKAATLPVQPRMVTKMFSGMSGICAEPDLVTNSFVGTEEYLAPEVIKGVGHNATVDWWTFGILIYEMLYGCTPFRGQTRDHTLQNIKQIKLNFPPHKRGGISKECKHLLKSLLHRDPKKRLGAVGGAVDIKDHPFFKGTKWQLMRHQTPPVVPQLKDPLDTNYFRPIKELEEEPKEESEIDPTDLPANDAFKHFNPVDNSERDFLDRETEKKEQLKQQQLLQQH